MALTDIARVARPGPDRSRRDPSAPFRHIDVLLVVSTLAIIALGVLMVFSTTRGPDDPPAMGFAARQALFAALGLVVATVVAAIDYRRFRDWAPVLYGVAIVGLIAVISPLGNVVNGAQRSFDLGPFALQPAEFAKVAVIVALSALVAEWRGEIDLRRLAVVLALAGLPMALIVVQPDLGTMLVFVAITTAILLVGGLRGRVILALALLGIGGVFWVLNSDVLAEYQKARLTAFADPGADTQGFTYNLNQSIATVATGGVSGHGLFEGPQTQLSFVPEQQTDFIFTAVAEELGFVGAATLLGLYAVLIWRILRIAALARDQFGTLLCVGVFAMFMFQIFENVGMVTGIMPVTGIPLPFFSYGGSSMLTSCMAVGLVLSVHMRRFR